MFCFSFFYFIVEMTMRNDLTDEILLIFVCCVLLAWIALSFC